MSSKIATKSCINAGCEEQNPQPASNFRPQRAQCRSCENRARAERYEAERQSRLTSKYDALGSDNFHAMLEEKRNPRDEFLLHGKDLAKRGKDRQADKQKKQEYNKLMGELTDFISTPEIFSEKKIEELSLYTAFLAEDEQRFMDRRSARAIALHIARDALARREWKAAAREFLTDKIVPAGYAKKPHDKPLKRTVVLKLSDLHLGSDHEPAGNPAPFRAIEEARRMEFILRQVVDYKPQYREDSELLILLSGDIIEGQLGHDKRAAAPGAEQRMIFLKIMGPFIAHCALAFKRVRVSCVPGNHGRDIARHPGRALQDPWDGIETTLYEMLQIMCEPLKNVEFHIPMMGVALVDLHGATLLQIHGDREPPIANPDTGMTKNLHTLAKFNNSLTYGRKFDVVTHGHWHMPRVIPKLNLRIISNGALVPPGPFSRSIGGVDEAQGQYLFEAVEGHPVGDLRFLEVGASQDHDEALGTLLKPFRFKRDTHGLYAGGGMKVFK